tara:strand:+ start:159 stop:332 length:174 start_codon:yes stop_codon:yes gene_type:complete
MLMPVTPEVASSSLVHPAEFYLLDKTNASVVNEQLGKCSKTSVLTSTTDIFPEIGEA